MTGRAAAAGARRGRGCSVGACGDSPHYVCAYRYARKNGRAVTSSRVLCVRHARLFSMKYSLAWPTMLVARARRGLASAWAQLAA